MKYVFVFSFMFCSERSRESTCRNGFFFDEPSNHKRPVTNNKEYKMSKQKLSNFCIFIRAIRTRTVDFLGKTDQTDYYQNDSNCFKDPTCLFLHWALSLTDRNIS